MRRILVGSAFLCLAQLSQAQDDLGPRIKELAFLETGGELRCIAISGSAKLLAVADSGQIHIWSIADKKRKSTVVGGAGSSMHLRFGKDDTELVSVGMFHDNGERTARVRIWDVSENKLKGDHRLEGIFKHMSNDGRFMLTLPEPASKTAFLVDLVTKKRVELKADAVFNRCYICPKNKSVISFNDSDVYIWDCPSGELRHKIPHTEKEHRYPRSSISGDGKIFLMTTRGKGTSILGTATGKVIMKSPLPESELTTLFPDGKHCLLHGGVVWSLERTEAIGLLVPTPRRWIDPIYTISDDGRLVALSTSDGKISIWEIPNGSR